MPKRSEPPSRQARNACHLLLQRDLREYALERGCWHCKEKRHVHIAHLDQARDTKLRPPKQVAYAKPGAARVEKFGKLITECKHCGVLCSECHHDYDGPLRGAPMMPWDAQFKDRAPTVADWDQYGKEFLCLSEIVI